MLDKDRLYVAYPGQTIRPGSTWNKRMGVFRILYEDDISCYVESIDPEKKDSQGFQIRHSVKKHSFVIVEDHSVLDKRIEDKTEELRVVKAELANLLILRHLP